MEVTGKAEHVIQEAGCGPFQICLVIVVFCLLKIPAAFTMMFMSFGNYNPGWRCLDNTTVSDHSHTINGTHIANASVGNFQKYNDDADSVIGPLRTVVDYTKGSCPDFEACENVEFHPGTSTIVTEWGLLCSKNWIASLIISIQMTGLFIGAFVSGYVGDSIGRKKVLYIAIAANGIFQFVGAFMNSWQSFAGIQFLTGLVLAVVVSQYGVLTSELLSAKWRGRFYPLPTWAMASMIMAVVTMICKDWRYMLIITATMCGLCCLTAIWVPESLRWLEVKSKSEEFNKVAKKILLMNKKPVPIELNRIHWSDAEKYGEETKAKRYTLLDLFRRGYRLHTVTLGFIWMSVSLVYFAISFGVKALSGNFFVNLIIMNAIEIPLTAFPVLLPNIIGRKKSALSLMAVTASCLLATAIREMTVSGNARKVGALILALVAKSLANGSWNILYVITAEVYPTVVRSIGNNYGKSMARLGGILAPFLIPADPESVYICYIVMGVWGIACCLAMNALPETKGKALKETFDDE